MKAFRGLLETHQLCVRAKREAATKRCESPRHAMAEPACRLKQGLVVKSEAPAH